MFTQYFDFSPGQVLAWLNDRDVLRPGVPDVDAARKWLQKRPMLYSDRIIAAYQLTGGCVYWLDRREITGVHGAGFLEAARRMLLDAGKDSWSQASAGLRGETVGNVEGLWHRSAAMQIPAPSSAFESCLESVTGVLENYGETIARTPSLSILSVPRLAPKEKSS